MPAQLARDENGVLWKSWEANGKTKRIRVAEEKADAKPEEKKAAEPAAPAAARTGEPAGVSDGIGAGAAVLAALAAAALVVGGVVWIRERLRAQG